MSTKSGELPVSIGPYKILGRLGEGGMGTVYRAALKDDPSVEVALKVILGSLTEDEDTLKRFKREAALLESFRHVNIVSLLNIGVAGNQLFFAMELLEGVPLSAYKGRPFTETVPLFIQVCRGMSYLASRSIVHRDLSPGNVLVSKGQDGPVVKVLDFGIAKNVEAHGTLDSFTKTGLVMGKPAYWSPEQLGVLEPGEKIDWRSDVYAVGVIFYLVLSGRLPISADSPYSFAAKHLSERPDPVVAPSGNPPLPARLVEIIEKMLEKKRANRPQSYEEIIKILELSLEEAKLYPTRARTQTAKVAVPIDSAQTAETYVDPNLVIEGAAPAGSDVIPVVPKPFPALPIAMGILATLVVVGGVWSGIHFWPSKVVVNQSTEGPATTPTVPLPVVPGQEGKLSLQAMPWARVLLVTEKSTGKKIALPADVTTPVVLDLPAGEYEIDLASGISGARRQIVLRVPGNVVTEHTESFETPAESVARLD